MPVTAVRLGGRPDLPLLVLGPSLGTSAQTLWREAARLLGERFQVVGWDLPGHGHNRGRLGPDPVTMESLAADVLRVVDDLTGGFGGASFHYAGDSVGGAVGLQLLLDAPERVTSATLLCTGAKIGTSEAWTDRQGVVTASGTAAMVDGSRQRWFGPGYADREPALAGALLRALVAADDAGYVAVCGALASFDVRDRLGEIAAPVLAVAGSDDGPTPPTTLAEIAEGVQQGRLVVLDGVGHLAPVEAPAEVARLVTELAFGPDEAPEPDADPTDTPTLDARSQALVEVAALAALGDEDRVAARVERAVADGVPADDLAAARHAGAAAR